MSTSDYEPTSLLDNESSFNSDTQSSRVHFQNKIFPARRGGLILLICVILFVLSIILLSTANPALPESHGALLGFGLFFLFVSLITPFGLFSVSPNTARLVLLFGEYKGTVETNGLWWTPPWYSKKFISTKLTTTEIDPLKCNDLIGNPIMVSAIITWRATNPAAAAFSVDNHKTYIGRQSEVAVRELVARFSYDVLPTASELSAEPLPSVETETVVTPTLLGHIAEVSEELKRAVQSRVHIAGITIETASINHLAYAQEISSLMLQKQTASAFIQSRRYIVSASVGIARDVLSSLQGTVDFTPEKRQDLISNLLIILAGDRQAQPVLSVNQ